MPLDQDLLRRAKEQHAQEQAATERLSGTIEVEREVDSEWESNGIPEEQDGDPSFVGEAGRALWGATVDAVSETALFALDVADAISPVEELLWYAQSPEGTTLDEAFAQEDEAVEEFVDAFRGRRDELAPHNKTLAGGLVRGVAQFLVPYAGWSKAVTAANNAGRMTNAFRAGFLADMSAFDPNDGNLSNLLEQHTELGGPVAEFLATNPGDSDALNRLRNGLEGLGLGAATEGFLAVMRGMRRAKALKRQRQAEADAAGEKTRLDEPEEVIDDAANSGVREGDDGAAADAAGEGAGGAARGDVSEPASSVRERVGERIKIEGETKDALIRAIEADDYSEAKGLLEFNENTINWDGLEDGDGVRQLLNTFTEKVYGAIEEAKGGTAGVQSHKQTVRLANLVGTSSENVHKLFSDVRGDRGVTARMLAAEKTMLASAQRLKRLAQVAKDTGQDADRLAFHRQVELHAGIMAEVRGAKAELARAVNAMRLMKSASEESFREFEAIRKTFGGHRDEDALIDAILGKRNLEELNAQVVKSTGRRVRDAILELAINGMLSQPKTHLINIASNIVNTGLGTVDRYIAGIGRATLGDTRVLREANADMIAKITALKDAFRLAGRAFREGRPITDVRQRAEFATRRNITNQLLGVDEKTALGRAVNVIGEAIRFPGRMLMTGDEFFKTVNVRGETAAQAYRQAAQQADAKGLKGGAWVSFVKKRQAGLIADPDPLTQARAIEQARYATFQESPQTQLGRNLEHLINANGFVKLVIAPFFRTPMNIMRQVVADRTPLGILIRRTKREIAEGGAQRDIALARMTTGVGAIYAGYELVKSGGPDKPFEIVGKRTYGNTEMVDGVRDYSIRLGDTWYQFNRLDPLGSWLGMVADVSQAMDQGVDPGDRSTMDKAAQMGQAAVFAAYQNTINKSWFTSVQDLQDLLTKLAEGKPETAERALDQYFAEQVFKLVPYSGLVRGGGVTVEGIAEGEDPVVREAWEFMDRLRANFPMWNDDLPPKRDFLGREVRRENSELYAINPFASSPESEDPLDRELARLAFDHEILPKSIENHKVQLTAAQYSEYKRLIGQEPFLGGQTLEEVLRDFVQSEGYRSMPTDQMRINAIKDMYSSAKSVAKDMLVQQDEDLRQKVFDAQLTEIEELTGERPDVQFPTGQ